MRQTNAETDKHSSCERCSPRDNLALRLVPSPTLLVHPGEMEKVSTHGSAGYRSPDIPIGQLTAAQLTIF